MSTLRPKICSQCGAAVEVGLSLKGVCDFCGTTLVVERPIIQAPPPAFNTKNNGTNFNNAQSLLDKGLAFLLAGDFDTAEEALTQVLDLAPSWFLPYVYLAKAVTKGFTDFSNIMHAKHMRKAEVLGTGEQFLQEALEEYNHAKATFVRTSAEAFRQKAVEYNSHDTQHMPTFNKAARLKKIANIFMYISIGILGAGFLFLLLDSYVVFGIVSGLGAIFLVVSIIIFTKVRKKATVMVHVGNESEEMLLDLIRLHRAITFIDPHIIANVEVVDAGQSVNLKEKWHHIEDEF